MLDRNEMVSLAKSRGLSPWQEEKRYVHALVLYALRDQPLVLKGGTYLWFFHGLDRFSDDLDFTEERDFREDLRSVVTSRTRLFGLLCECKLIKNDRFTISFRVDARGPLYTARSDLSRIYVEVSKRDKVKSPVLPAKLDEPPYGLPLVFLKGMGLSEVAAEKMRAVIRRRKARDVYDLWYLLKRKVVSLDGELADGKLSFYNTSLKTENLDAALQQTRRDWSKELRPVVFGEIPSHQQVCDDILRALRDPKK